MATVWPEGLYQRKLPNDTTNRNRDLPTCSEVPQPNETPRAPVSSVTDHFHLCNKKSDLETSSQIY
jgi:hypothetical protein